MGEALAGGRGTLLAQGSWCSPPKIPSPLHTGWPQSTLPSAPLILLSFGENSCQDACMPPTPSPLPPLRPYTLPFPLDLTASCSQLGGVVGIGAQP